MDREAPLKLCEEDAELNVQSCLLSKMCDVDDSRGCEPWD